MSSQKAVSVAEVSKHNQKDSCWVVVHGKVYDLTEFLPQHPGGQKIILKYAGKDATKKFDPIHPPDTLDKYLPKDKHLGPVEQVLPAATVQKISPNSKKLVAAKTVIPSASKTKPVVTDTSFKPKIKTTVAKVMGAQPSIESNIEDNENPDDEFNRNGVYDLDDAEEVEKFREFQNRPALSQIYNLLDFESVARRVMTKAAWAYYSSGADDEITLRENHRAYHKIFFKPSCLIDVSSVDYSTTMLGSKTAVPFYISATALGKLGHPKGETVLTKSAGREGVIQMVPTLASCSFDEIIDTSIDSQTQWLQLYVNGNREITKRFVQHAESRGVKGLFITVDAPQLGRREKDMRSKYEDDAADVQGGSEEVDRSQGAARAISSFIDASLSWKDMAWFKSITKLPIVLKGVQRADDAIRAVEHGLQGIVISNHGGRQLDFSRPAIEILVDVMAALRERGLENQLEVFVDGGVRRATDIIKALCLGAKGVGLGRPFIYAMSTYGEAGVTKAIQLLKDEFEMNMRLLGVNRIDQLNPSFLDTRSLSTHSTVVSADSLSDQVYERLVTPPFRVPAKL